MDERKNLFRRILFTCVVGITAAKLSHFPNPIIISFPSLIIVMAMKRYDLKIFSEKAGSMILGLFSGIVVTEVLSPLPQLESLLVYMIFLTALKLFSYRYKTNTVFLFVFTFMYSSIFSSYRESNFDTEVLQYFWEMIWVFVIVSGAFLIFPSNLPSKEVESLEKSDISNGKVMFFALILTIVWGFSMMFEWRFAYFAYVALISLFQDFELENMKEKAFENIKVNFLACTLTALFSLILYGIISNILLMILGLVIIFIPFIYKGVYAETPKTASVNFGIVSGLIFPMTIYINLSGAAVHDSFIRSVMITFLMVVILFIINLFPDKINK